MYQFTPLDNCIITVFNFLAKAIMHSILYITILIYVLSCQHISADTSARPKPPPLRLQCPITLGNPTEVIFQDISEKKIL